MAELSDLNSILSALNPTLDSVPYTFALLPQHALAPIGTEIGRFHEKEGTTVICSVQEADKLGLQRSGEMRRITLAIHSSLDSVGLTYSVSKVLAANNIPCNVVAAFHHDHLFVPASAAEQAFRLLVGISKGN